MKQPHNAVVVSKQGDGDFTTLTQAVQSVKDGRREEAVIFIKSGIYEEKVFVRKENLTIIGEDADTTILRYGDGAKKMRPNGREEYGTFNTAVLFLAGSRITVKNLTVENTAGPGCKAGQALAVYVASDQTAFIHCRFLGCQDTVFAGDLSDRLYKLMLPPDILQSTVPAAFPVIRNYFEDCFISGDVDFIFGPNTAYFNRCEIFSQRLQSEDASYITAASTPAGQTYGFVFHRCSLTGSADKGSVYLGRPWRDYAKTAFLECFLGEHIAKEGWSNWGRVGAEVNLNYLEYQNTGPGASTCCRAPFCRILTNPEIPAYFSKKEVLGGWDPPSSL